MRKKLVAILIIAVAVLYSVMLILYSHDINRCISDSLNTCMTVIIPSLYAFMVLTGFLISTDLYKLISKPFSFISRYLFRIPSEYFSIFLISSVAGYPVGAKLLTDLKVSGKIDKKTAEDMLPYCYLGGPAFICGAVGITLFSSVKAGMTVFLSVFAANVIIAVLIGLFKKIPPKSKEIVNVSVSFDKMIYSVVSGAKSLFVICAIIIFFSTFICILDNIGVIDFFAHKIEHIFKISYTDSEAFIKTILEISNVSKFSYGCYNLLPAITGLMSFGGICIIIQIKSTVVNNLSIKHFVEIRILSAFISYFCSIIIIKLLINQTAMQTLSFIRAGHRHITPIPTIFLLIMTILLLSKNYIVKT